MKPKFTAVLSSQEEEEAEMAQTRLVQANAACALQSWPRRMIIYVRRADA